MGPLGLGHYLLGKVQSSMQKNGLLTVGKVAGKSGQHVFINGHQIGLSNKLLTLTGWLAVPRIISPSCTSLLQSSPRKSRRRLRSTWLLLLSGTASKLMFR